MILFDIDETLTTTISGQTFKQNPKDIKVLPGVEKGLDYHLKSGYIMVGVSIAAGYKSLLDTVEEMKYTLELLPQLAAIYFCPDFAGNSAYRLLRGLTSAQQIEGRDFRKPGAGMLSKAIREFGDTNSNWMIGDRAEDEEAARLRGIRYLDASIWRSRFLPGITTIPDADVELIEFLEGVKLKQ